MLGIWIVPSGLPCTLLGLQLEEMVTIGPLRTGVRARAAAVCRPTVETATVVAPAPVLSVVIEATGAPSHLIS